jgi:hypothetical protein
MTPERKAEIKEYIHKHWNKREPEFHTYYKALTDPFERNFFDAEYKTLSKDLWYQKEPPAPGPIKSFVKKPGKGWENK